MKFYEISHTTVNDGQKCYFRDPRYKNFPEEHSPGLPKTSWLWRSWWAPPIILTLLRHCSWYDSVEDDAQVSILWKMILHLGIIKHQQKYFFSRWFPSSFSLLTFYPKNKQNLRTSLHTFGLNIKKARSVGRFLTRIVYWYFTLHIISRYAF